MLPQSDETSVPDCSESDTADSRLASGFIYEEDEKRTSRDWSNWDEFSVALPLIERNYTFYFSLVTFRVGNQLFRVPRERFANFSEVFRDMFAIDACSTVPHEGDSDDNPIHLEGVEEGAFEDLLHLLYPECLKAGDTSTPDDENFCLRWERVLALSHMWQFHDIRCHTISKLEGFEYDGISRAQLAQKYKITS
ncbi:uncharacterized protein FOMMEDRAFT_95837 [Fomitiporia mediterranea MF3/22]|uniref:uncharacterized protein n=1 Tax=Fomitiporia mediterranea (strain MF3/22) TaxID=694068 RepID=UPI000440923B|nr:uncharacterized protein FOMMEDRAFT_95837 [Fomitiporia mediterranea MF3/22]EJC98680.1 hypothetical protein FOMMEDRAFT_95837 [Fomitiporia mediterranea MF3/22]